MSKLIDKLLHHGHHDKHHKRGGDSSGDSNSPATTPSSSPALRPVADSGVVVGSGETSSVDSNSLQLDSDLNSPVASGSTTPRGDGQNHFPLTKGAASRQSTDHGTHKASPLGASHSPDDGAKVESERLSKELSKEKEKDKEGGKCNDVHQHFLAIKSALAGKKGSRGSQSPTRTSTESSEDSRRPVRPGMHHTKTEEDERALRVDKAVELQQAQLKRELAYKEAYESDPLNGNYGFLNVDATPNAVDTSGK